MNKDTWFFAACSLLAIVLNVSAQPSASSQNGTRARLPWRLSDEERIAARVAAQPAVTGGAPQPSAASGFREYIDGKQQPELLLPYELFDDLLEGLSANEHHRMSARRLLDPQLPAFGFQKETFWPTLGTIAGRYLNAREESSRLHRQATAFTTAAGVKTFVPINRADCSLRVMALNDARRRFGGMGFDRFLYTAVAPYVSRSINGGAGDRAAQLRFMAGGCK